MSDISQTLNEILKDPESMERVRKMAENLFSGEGSKDQPDPGKEHSGADSGLSGEELNAIISIMSHLKSGKEDDRTHLLNALKPYLSESRQNKADNAIRILKLLEILPLLKDSGLLKF